LAKFDAFEKRTDILDDLRLIPNYLKGTFPPSPLTGTQLIERDMKKG